MVNTFHTSLLGSNFFAQGLDPECATKLSTLQRYLKQKEQETSRIGICLTSF